MICSGKNIFITGANRGMGNAFAHEAEKRGAQLILHARQWKESDKKSFKRAHEHTFLEAELSDDNSLDKMIQKIDDVDIVLNNAGVLTGDLIENQSNEEIFNVMNINAIVPMKITRALLPKLLLKRQGLIVNNTSVSAIMRFPLASTYAASKAALMAFSECLNNELVGTNVRTLTLFTPGIQTDMFQAVHQQYSKNMDVSMMSSMPAEEYAIKVFDTIERNKNHYWPGGSSGIGLWIARHLPWLFNFFVSKNFKR